MLHTFHKTTATVSGLEPNKPTESFAGSKKIGLLKKGDQVFAFSATCPHSGAPMCDGWLDAMGRLVCPLHKYRFDPTNGRNTSGEGYKLLTYPTEIRGEEVYVGLLANEETDTNNQNQPGATNTDALPNRNIAEDDEEIDRW